MSIGRQARLVFVITFVLATLFGLVAIGDMVSKAEYSKYPVGVVPSPDPPKGCR